jgi:hypothetical protein
LSRRPPRAAFPVTPLLLSLVYSLALAVPAGAGAATFCAGVGGCATGDHATIQGALDAAAAAPGRDTVRVGAPDDAAGFTIAAGNAVDVLPDADADGRGHLQLDGPAGIVVEEPTAVVAGFEVLTGFDAPPVPAIDLKAGTLRDVEVFAAVQDPVIRLGAGTLDGITFPHAAPGSRAVQAVGPGGVIQDSQLFAGTALTSSSDALVVRTTILEGRAWSAGSSALKVTDGATTLDDVGLYAGGAAAPVAVDVAPGAADDATLTLRSVTVRGDGQPTLSTGVRATCASGGTATVSLVDTAVFGSDTDLQRAAPGCAMSLDHVRYRTRDAGTGGTISDGPGVSSGPVGPFGTWLDPGFDSPLIDAGSARAATDTDVDGRPRVVDGDADGTATRDIGAVEYQRRAPDAVLADAKAWRGYATTLSAAESSDPDGGDHERLTYAWAIDGAPASTGVDAQAGTLTTTFATLGAHAVALTVTDPTGQSDTATATVTVGEYVSPPYDPPRPPRPPGDPGTTTPPALPPPAVPRPPSLPNAMRTAIGAGLQDSRLHGRGGRLLRVSVTCFQHATCRGRIVLRSGKVTLGRSPAFRIKGDGHNVTLSVPIGKAARAYVRRHRKGVDVRIAVVRLSGKGWTIGGGGHVTA